MGLGSDMLSEVMIDHYVEKDLQHMEERKILFNTIEEQIKGASDIKDLKRLMLILLNLIKEQT